MTKKETEVWKAADQKGSFNVEYFIFNYGRFHNDGMNKFIHLVFIPIIAYTAMIALFSITPRYEIPEELHDFVGAKWISSVFFFAAVPLMLVYLWTDIITGLFFILWFGAQAIHATRLVDV